MIYLNKGLYDVSHSYHKKAYNIVISKFPGDHLEVGNAMNHLGNVHLKKCEYDNAIDLYKQTLDIYLKKLGE